MINSESLTLITLGFVSMLAITTMLVVVMYLVKDRSRSGYDKEGQHSVLSEMRAAYEKRISDLNMQLTATEQRWRDVNHLVVSGQKSQSVGGDVKAAPLTNFLRNLGVQEEDLQVDRRLVVVLTPFSLEEEPVYLAIKGVCARAGFTCVRGDEEFAEGDILSHIAKLIVRSRLVIANIGGRNANVFYELGIAQALDKPAILVSRTLDDVPFDVKTKRIILFSSNTDLDKQLTRALLQLVAHPTAAS